MGLYKNKACNKRKRKTIHFAIIVFKKTEDAQVLLRDPRYIQNIVNKIMKKNAKFVAFNGDSDDDQNSGDEKTPQDQ